MSNEAKPNSALVSLDNRKRDEAYSGMPMTDSNDEVVSLNIINNQNTQAQNASHMQQDANEGERESFRSETAQLNNNILQFIKQNNLQSNADL